MGVEPYNFVSALNCIMAQRLVRLICSNCKRPKKLTDIELSEAGIDPAIAGSYQFVRRRGLPGMLRHGLSWPQRDLRIA